MAAYVVFTLNQVHDETALQAYRQAGRSTLGAHGARFVAGPVVAETLEGAPIEGAVMLEFDSVEAARAWYRSPEYQAVVGTRLAATEGGAFIIKARG